MTAHPIDLTIVDGVDVAKGGVRSYEKQYSRLSLADADAVRNTSLSGHYGGVYVRSLEALFDLDTADTTSADDGALIINDADGNRFRRVIGIIRRAMARVATTANIAIATALNNGDTLDGIALVTGDRVLVKDQTAQSENGVFIVGTAPARAADFDSYEEHVGALIVVTAGTVNANTIWLGANNAGGTLGTDNIQFASIATATRVELGISISGAFPGNDEIVEGHVFSDPVTFPAGLAGSKATARDVATAQAVFDILHNGSSVGTVTFSIGAATGTFAMASNLSAIAGSQVDIQCPAVADVTLRGIKITLRGSPP